MKTCSFVPMLAGLALVIAFVDIAAQPVPPPTPPGAQPSADAPPTPAPKRETPAERRARGARIDALEAAVLRRLASPEAARLFHKYNAEHGRKIQHHLVDIYGTEPAFVAEAGGKGGPLSDSIVGPVTLKWLARFCSDYGIVASDPGFEQDVVASLEQLAGIARAHPDWLKILFSAEFEAWINGQPTPQRIRNFKIRRSGAAAQVNALIEQYLQSLRPQAAVPAARPALLEVTYAYDPKKPAGIESLAVIAQRLKPLALRDAAEEEWFLADVREALAGIEPDPEALGLIKRYSQIDVYMIRPELLVRWRKEGMPEPAVIALQEQMGGLEFGTVQEFVDALAVVAEASPDGAAILAGQRGFVREARLARYKIPDTLAADLAADGPLEQPLADLFAGIANVRYPNKVLFDRALEWQVQRALGMCPEANNRYAKALDDKAFDALAALPPTHGKLFARIRELRAVRGGCTAELLAEADALAYEAYLIAAPRFDRKMDLETRHVVMPEKPRESNWAVPGCHCGRAGGAGLVYSFYPLWTQAGERQIDFGMVSHIGLYGLTMDDTGGLRAPPGMPVDSVPDRIAALMREAHQHHVQVEWVVARSDWTAWSGTSRANRKNVFDKLIASIEAKLGERLPGNGQAMIRLASLGADTGPTAGDGVALYFRAFPAADKDMFNDFVKSLTARLKAMRPVRNVSVMVDFAELGTPGPFDYRNLVDLIAATNTATNNKSFADSRDAFLKDMPILVMLPEPTAETKKNLRGGIQDALRGTASMRLMRSMVPILGFDGTSPQDTSDAIVYAGDNYSGIGFWPLAFASPADEVGNTAAEATTVNRLLALYLQAGGDGPSPWAQSLAFLCPERLWLRWVVWIALLVATVVGVVYFRCRGCNERVDGSVLYFSGMLLVMALPLIALPTLVLSDPVLQPFAPVMLVLYGTGGLVVAGLVARYYFNKSRRKVP